MSNNIIHISNIITIIPEEKDWIRNSYLSDEVDGFEEFKPTSIKDFVEPQNSFSASFTCNIDNTTCSKLFGSKRERYETNSIHRYSHTKKSRKKKQMLRYCKKYNWEIVGVAK